MGKWEIYKDKEIPIRREKLKLQRKGGVQFGKKPARTCEITPTWEKPNLKGKKLNAIKRVRKERNQLDKKALIILNAINAY